LLPDCPTNDMNTENRIRTIGKKVRVNTNASTKLRDVAVSVTSSIKHQGTINDEIYLREISKNSFSKRSWLYYKLSISHGHVIRFS
jgi:hypothetical protein